MKRIHILGKNPGSIEKLKADFRENGFDFVEEAPDLVVSYGGDGMFLIAERVFPGVPKILIRDSDIGRNCCDINLIDALKKYCDGDYKIEEIKKLKAIRKGRFEFRELIGVNDIVIRNSLPTEAIRFRYRINKEDWSKVLIGDGVVVSTPYGSTKGAYFYSIEQESFEKGIGVAFNNVTEKKEALFLDEGDLVEVEIMRGIGVLVSDNNRDFVNLEVGDKIKISLINDVARRVVLNSNKI
jgi:hypothetical protein